MTTDQPHRHFWRFDSSIPVIDTNPPISEWVCNCGERMSMDENTAAIANSEPVKTVLMDGAP